MTNLTPSHGHHMDELLIPYPYALLSSAMAFDLGARLSGRTAWSQTASKLAATGLGTALAAGLPGLAREFTSLPEEPALRRGAAAHMICNISSLACFAAARSQRHHDGYMPTSGLVLELVGAGLLALGGLHKERQEMALEQHGAQIGRQPAAVTSAGSSPELPSLCRCNAVLPAYPLHIQLRMAAPILDPGRNCWRLDRADRFHAVQDAADYFRLVRRALLSARHTVFILGWDMTAGIDLDPDAAASKVPTRFDKLLAYVVRRRRTLRCYILTWDYGLLFTLERDPLSRFKFGWAMPRRVRFEFDDRHPLGGCHHQKVVVVDDQLAFCGGIDLTSHRWDTTAHRPDEPRRVTPLGTEYGPYHEVQAMVDGPAAASLGALARDRWRVLGAERLPPMGGSSEPLWPADLTPDLTDVDVAISRTMPGSDSQAAVRECEALFLDSIAAARRSIYIENQYFTNSNLADALAARLAEPDGPEVVLAVPRDSHGWLEHKTIGAIRDHLFRGLLASDRYSRLRLVAPVASRARDLPTFVHSKVTIVDDEFVRIGSANCSHRSMGVDTECDVAIEARGDRTVRAGIRRIRDRLIGEHLGLPVRDVGPAIERAGSLGALLDAQGDADRTLVRIALPVEALSPPSEAVRLAVDPDEPVAIGASLDRVVPAMDASIAPASLRVWIVPMVAVTAASVVVWASAASPGPPGFHALQAFLSRAPDAPANLAIGVGVFVIGAVALIPLEVLAIASGVLVGGPGGGLVAMGGSLAAAVVGYVAGRAIGTTRLSRWMSRRSYRSGRQLGARGVVGVAVLRLASVASAGAVHLLCGAARIPLGAYLAGTAIGLAPAVALLVWFGTVARTALLHPSPWTGVAAVAAGVVVAGLSLSVRTLLLARQFAPSVSGHRERTEFG